MKLLCFPFAGASSGFYLKWKRYFGDITIVPVDLPGRGRRIAEPLCQTIKEAVDDLKVQVLPVINEKEQYTVYGHSMGSLLIFELLHELLETGEQMPVHIFLSGKNPPPVAIKKPIHQLSDEKFIKKVVALGGMEDRFFEKPTLTKVFLPVLRADFGIIENYRYEKKKQLLPVDISFFFVSDDKSIKKNQVKHWADFTSKSFQMYYFNGGHFFIMKQGEEIAGIIKETLSETHNIIPY
jgi:surfactin synthase thioesterase subunit